MLTGAAGHGAAAVAAADNESGFEHGRENDDALGFVQQVRGDVVRNVQNFLENGAAIVQTIGLLFVLLCGKRKSDQGPCHQE